MSQYINILLYVHVHTNEDKLIRLKFDIFLLFLGNINYGISENNLISVILMFNRKNMKKKLRFDLQSFGFLTFWHL